MSKNIRFSALLCLTTLFIKWTNSYVLLAANLEDFKKVAKKFVPEKLAMQIAEIATANTMNRVTISYNLPQPEPERVQEEAPVQEPPIDEKDPVEEEDEEEGAPEVDGAKYLRENNRQISGENTRQISGENTRQISGENEDNPALKQMDFEDLVQQVKKRIEHDILKKQMKFNLKQQKKSYAELEHEDLEKKIVEKVRPEQIFSVPKHIERNTGHSNREVKNPGRNAPKNKYPPHREPEINNPTHRYPPEKKSDENSPERGYPQEKRPKHKEESYVDQEEDNPRQQSEVKEYGNQHSHDKREKNEEQSKLNDRSNEEQEKGVHDQDEIDVNGKLLYNHQQYKDKQRHVKNTPTFDLEEQTRTVSPGPHGRYKENREPPVEDDDDLLFTKINMTRHDSYDDYPIPKKERNPYVEIRPSNEANIKERPRNTNSDTNNMEVVPFAAKVTNEYEEGDKNEYYNDDAENLKARTENLGFSYEGNQETERQNSWEQTTPMNKALVHKKESKKGKATMIPKRDFYKISSPNYYAKIPIVAEKYDFNEPIPEKDREPEDTRSFPMPPSAINGKVRI